MTDLGDDAVETTEGHHATTKECGEIIEESEEFIIPENPIRGDKLGPGVYFWKDSLDAAQRWGALHLPDGEFCVVAATVDLGLHLNIDDAEDAIFINEAAKRLREATNSQSVSLSQVLAFLAEHEGIDSSSAQYDWKGPAPWGTLDEPDISICVYNTSLIKDPCVVWP